jgi:3-hydroxyisobutyrate dehydrogenase-like beta-hydroxyacid dehydrogenase
MKNDKVGFIGLGMLDEPMALNLLKAGVALSVYNRTPEKAAALAAQGAELKADPWETAESGGIVMTCLSDDQALEAVVGPDGELARRLGKGGVHVSMSIILPKTVKRLAKQPASYGGHYVLDRWGSDQAKGLIIQ